MKKNLLIIPAWYPTKDNPVLGSFFREQAIMLSEHFKVTVVIPVFRTSTLKKRPVIRSVSDSGDFSEYMAEIYSSQLLEYREKYMSYRIWHKRADAGTLLDAVGRYHSDAYKHQLRETAKAITDALPQKPELIYGTSAQGIAYLVRMIAEEAGVPYVLGEHSPFPVPGTRLDDMLKEGLEGAGCFLAISNDKIRQVLLQNIKLKRICYVGNPVDDSIFTYAPVDHATKTLLIVAAHSYYKNYDMFILTMETLAAITEVPFKIVIAGYGANKGYAKDVEQFEKQIKSSSIADRAELIPSVARKDMPALYNRCDAFVMTSIQEGQPVSALEAAFCGLPIFSTRCGGVEDYVTDEIGRLVDITDTAALAGHLKQFLEGEISFDPSFIREKVSERYSKEIVTGKITECFNDLGRIGEL